MSEQIDSHTWGQSDYLDAQEYNSDETVKVLVKEFLGRIPYQARAGEQRKAYYYKVSTNGVLKQFRLGLKNEQVAAGSFRVSSPEALVGKYLTLRCKKFPLANGWVLELVEDAETKKVPSYAVQRQPAL